MRAVRDLMASLGSGRRFRPIAVPALAIVAALAAASPVAAQQRGPQTVAPIAEKLIDAVVNISTSQTVKGPQGVPLPRVPKGSPFEEFFDDFFNKRGGQRQDRKVSSLGSGFVIDGKAGLIVTNNHVIDGADEITINFNDGSKLKVDKVLGKDTKTDLALLKVTPTKPLPEVKFGSSGKLKVGDWVLAIGNPFGLGGTVTLGIISAKQRDINSGPYDEFIQTDAAINKGNSGGPLFNMDGEVIGVNTAIISPTGGSIGIGFAVPADTATLVISQLQEFGETRRGWLGVRLQSVTDDIAEGLGVKENTGALVSSVTPDSPAAKGGIEAGDVVLKFDGKDVSSMRGLPRLVAQTPVGKTIDVEVLRKGQRRTVKVTIGRLNEAEAAREQERQKDAAPPPQTGGGVSSMGMKLQALGDDQRRRHGIDGKVKGVLVTEVDAQSAAAQKNIKVGDVIVEVGQEAVNAPADVLTALDKVKKAGRKQVLLLVSDAKGDLRFIAVPVE